MAANDYNQLELAVGNAGLRFLLDNMSIKVSETVSYTDEQVRKAVVEGNIAQNSSNDGRYLTEDDMGEIISYADSNGIEIVPLVNMPGHLNAVLYVNPDYKLTDKNGSNVETTSATTLDLNNQEAYAFGQALLQKYVDYFKTQGVKYFNFGADEYALDIYNPYFSRPGGTAVAYSTLVSYMNDCAEVIENAGMTPRAFNDFVYYNGTPGVDTGIQVCYWSNQWDGSPYVTADVIGNAGYTLINTNQNWYYVPGTGYTLEGAISSIQENGYNQFRNASGSTTATASGTMVCIWSDDPNALTDTETVANAATLISAFAEKNPDKFDLPQPKPEAETRTINVVVNGTATDTINGANYAGTYTTENPSIATVEVTGTDATEATTTYTQASVTCNTLISSTSNNWTAVSGYYYKADDGNYYPLYAKRSGNYRYTYTWGYSTTSSTSNVTQIGTQNTTKTSTTPNITVYTKSGTDGTPASTTVTFTAAADAQVGTSTTVTVGHVTYTINIVPEDLSDKSIEVSLWITSKSVTPGTVTVNATDVYGEEGVDIESLVPPTGTYHDGDNNMDQDVVYWKSTYLTDDNVQKEEGWTNKSNKGTEFTKIRYYNGKWEVYTTAGEWLTVTSDETHQIAAYYVQKTVVTDEVTTYVVDYGQTFDKKATSYGTGYVTVDFAVMYESGERTRSSGPSNQLSLIHI